MTFRFLEHTADVLFEAEGSTFEEALEEAAKALSATAAESVTKKEEFEFEESAPNIEELVIAVLQKLHVEASLRSLLPGGIHIINFTEQPGECRIKARAWVGEGKAKTIIKGVTYGMLKVDRNETCKIRVLLDI